MMMYGITRQGFNDWLLNLEKKWLLKMNLTYIGRSGRQDSTYNSRGFIYALLKKSFSNTNTKLFRDVMWNAHEEYICVRKKVNRKGDCPINTTSLHCRWGKIYLCTKKKDINEKDERNRDLRKPVFESYQDHSKYWVITALQCGLTSDLLHRQVDRWKESYVRTEDRKMIQGK